MSKLTKFFKHPVRFFQDSKLFGKPDVSGVQKCKNLFFIANYGQLEQIQALIKYEHLSDCFVCVLYTPANKKMPKLIVDSIDQELIAGYYLAKLPVSPNRIHVENLIYIRRLYSRVIEKAQPDNIFLLSFEVHYSLIASIANQRNISLSLIEEGTGTYKFDDFGVNLAPVVDPEKFKRQVFMIRHLPFLAKIRPALETARNFDHIYAAFPELLKNAFNYKSLTRFLLHAPGAGKVGAQTLRVIEKYNITSDDIIFVSQRYSIEPDLFFNSLFDFLSELSQLSGSRVLIKLHPKESASSLKAARRKLDMLGADSNLILITENEFLIEPTIAYVKPKAVVGIASTSLAYTSLVSPKTASISFGGYLIPSLLNAGSQKLKELDVIQSHLGILDKFSKVFKVNTPELAFEAIGHHKDAISSSGGVDARLLSAAEVYFTEGKNWKAHCHFEWAVDGDVEQLSHSQFKNYFLNLLQLKDYNLVLKYLPLFIDRVEAKEISLDSTEYELLLDSVVLSLDESIVANDQERARELYKMLSEVYVTGATSSLHLRQIYMELRFGNDEKAANQLQHYTQSSTLSSSEVLTLHHLLYSNKNYRLGTQPFLRLESSLKDEVSLNPYEKDLLVALKNRDLNNNKKTPNIEALFGEFKSKLSKNYRHKFVKNKKSRMISVVFQEKIKPNRILEKNSNVLYIIDSTETYFTFNPVTQVSFLRSFIEKSEFGRVLFTGDGIGGFGAMLWSLLFNKKNDDFNCRCVVVNPVIELESTICNRYNVSSLESSINYVSGSYFKNFTKYHSLADQGLLKLPPTVVFDSSDRYEFLDDAFSNYFNVKVLRPVNSNVASLDKLYSAGDVSVGNLEFSPSYLITDY
ncbi:hypothetical protein VE30_14740 [Vreelandella aquamarina]|uniref:alpha-2,8-polysialyltransferase family protein n=1 Tax=Vreelandella aquamarina TaxID=77097 RepID=UPI0005CBEF57|nr:alpha-2,8-polysialyltransferase family protein [Halomonas meridiana]KJD18141.1 hypothetical protein VE30_14740 [Halomonas meridiana]|tara:strand:- start:3349 stop:5931 length:2583 start_codon:yes stop_codon:yes gene_type:complete